MQFIIRDSGMDEIIIDIPDIDKQIIEHYVPCFKEWIKTGPLCFVQNKSEARRKALVEETKSILKSQNLPIPLDDYEICGWAFAQSDYMNRKQRDAAQVADLKAQIEAAAIAAQEEIKIQQKAFETAVQVAIKVALTETN